MTEKNVELIQSIVLPIDEVENNTGQVPGLNANPREITITEYKKLKNSLAKNRGFTALNELKVFPWHGKWITIGGNMRLQAMRELGWAEVIAKPLPEDTDIETLNRYILLDNASFGKWDFDCLANEYDSNDIVDAAINIPTPEEDEGERREEDEKGGVCRHFTFSPEQVEFMKDVIRKAREQMPKDIAQRTDNANRNGNALFYIFCQWERNHNNRSKV